MSIIDDKYTKSQLFHLDKPGDYIKVFISLSNINNDNGPFTFIDSENSKRFLHSNKKILDSKKNILDKYEDKYIYSEFNQNLQRKFIGNFGNIVFCDTTRCLHQGSRVRKGYRLMLLLVYSLTNMEKDKASIILKWLSYLNFLDWKLFSISKNLFIFMKSVITFTKN